MTNDLGQVHHRGRDGELLSLTEWADRYEDPEYRVVAKSELLDVVVQTQWEGLDDGVNVGCMYATGVCRAGSWTTVWEGYWPCTEGEARAAHERAVAELA
jgi:hypothetical protein